MDKLDLALKAWQIQSVAEVLHAAMPDDPVGSLPVRTVVLHLAEMAQTVAEALDE